MIAQWVGLSSPLEFTISGQQIIIQEYLDQIMPQLLSLVTSLSIFAALRKGMKVYTVIIGIIVIGFIGGVCGILG